MSRYRNETLIRGIGAIAILLGVTAFWGGVIYVVIHYVAKFW